MSTKTSDHESFKILFEYFIDNFEFEFLFGDRKPTNHKERSIFEIFNRTNDIYSILERLGKYGIYFEKFYSDSDVISEAEAIEYHLHNYIQDVYSLKEKVNKLIGCIKNDLPHFEIDNPEKIRSALNHLKTQVENGLENTITLRHSHVHDLSIRDLEISQAKALKQVGETTQVNSEEIEQRYQELVNSARSKYTSIAEKNGLEFLKMEKYFVSRLGFVVATLCGHKKEIFHNMMIQTV